MFWGCLGISGFKLEVLKVLALWGLGFQVSGLGVYRVLGSLGCAVLASRSGHDLGAGLFGLGRFVFLKRHFGL